MATMMRGANVALTREVPTLRTVLLGALWDAGAERSLDENLVLAALLTDDHDKVLSGEHFVFFNQLTSPEESVAQRQQALGQDREQIEVSLSDVPGSVSRITVVLYVNEGGAQRRTLGQLHSCVLRVINAADGTELVRTEDLAKVLRAETAVSLGQLYRHEGGWKFRVLGQGYSNGMLGVAADYGLTL